MFFVVTAVRKNLIAVIRSAGGSVVREVDIESVLFDPNNTRRITGIRIHAGSMGDTFTVFGSEGCVSGLGVMHTHQVLMGMRPKSAPPVTSCDTSSATDTTECRLYTDPRCLLNASEARPKLHW